MSVRLAPATLACHFQGMHPPALSQSRRRNWREIHDYYRMGDEHSGMVRRSLLREFSYLAGQREHLGSLVTVGSLGCVLVFKDVDCIAERGYILIGGGQDGGIVIGFFADENFDPTQFAKFDEAVCAVDYFEVCLKEHEFLVVGT